MNSLPTAVVQLLNLIDQNLAKALSFNLHRFAMQADLVMFVEEEPVVLRVAVDIRIWRNANKLLEQRDINSLKNSPTKNAYVRRHPATTADQFTAFAKPPKINEIWRNVKDTLSLILQVNKELML